MGLLGDTNLHAGFGDGNTLVDVDFSFPKLVQDLVTTTDIYSPSELNFIHPRNHRHQRSTVGIAILRTKGMLWQGQYDLYLKYAQFALE